MGAFSPYDPAVAGPVFGIELMKPFEDAAKAKLAAKGSDKVVKQFNVDAAAKTAMASVDKISNGNLNKLKQFMAVSETPLSDSGKTLIEVGINFNELSSALALSI